MEHGSLKTELRKMKNRIKNPTIPFIPDADRLISIIGDKITETEPDEFNTRIFDVIHCAILRTRENMIDDETAKKYLELLETANNVAATTNYFTKKQTGTLLKWTETINERCNRSNLLFSFISNLIGYFSC